MTITERIKTLESALNGTPKPSKERTEYIQALLSDLQKQISHDANVIHPENLKTAEISPGLAELFNQNFGVDTPPDYKNSIYNF